MGTSGSTCILITASTALNSLTAERLTVRRPEETLATGMHLTKVRRSRVVNTARSGGVLLSKLTILLCQ